MQYVFNNLKENNPNVHVRVTDVFSDGPSSQFKPKFLFSNLKAWEDEHGITLKWNFFATSHGKGVVDGIVKRAVWRHVRSNQAHVSTPEQPQR